MGGHVYRIVMIDASPLFLSWVEGLFKGIQDLILMATADTYAQGFHLVGELRPDLVMIDGGLSDLFGVKWIQDLNKLLPSAVIVVTSNDPELEAVILAQGTRFLLKTSFSLNRLRGILHDSRGV